MNNEELAAFTAQYSEKMKVTENRLKDLEEQNKQILSISVSVEKLATSMEAMVGEQRAQGDRLKKLEEEPAKAWSSTKKTAFTSIISSIGTAIGGGLIWLFIFVSQNM